MRFENLAIEIVSSTFDEFYKRLSIASRLLYICDNSGEIVLDKIFLEEIKKAFPLS